MQHRLRPISGSAGRGYALFELPDSVVKSELACQLPEPSEEGQKKERYGKYFASVNRFRTPGDGRSGAVLMIWAKERNLWKIVGVKSADGPDPGVVTLERRPAPQAERPGDDASPDPAIVSAASDFLESWFVRRDYRKAMSYISAKAKACVESAAQDRGEAGFAGVAKRLPKAKELSLAIRPVTPWNSETKIVRHGKEDAFTLMSIPDGMAQAMQCDRAEPAGIAPPAASATARFYQTAFQLRLRNGESGALLSLWEKEGANWKLVAWEVQAP